MPAELPGRGHNGLAGLLARIITAVLALAVMIVGFMFSMVLLVAGVVAGVALFLWMWWKMRRALRQVPGADPHGASNRDAGPRGNGEVIEGEVLSGEWKEPPEPPDASTSGR